jgi:hypothetical protein
MRNQWDELNHEVQTSNRLPSGAITWLIPDISNDSDESSSEPDDQLDTNPALRFPVGDPPSVLLLGPRDPPNDDGSGAGIASSGVAIAHGSRAKHARTFDDEADFTDSDETMWADLVRAEDKYEAAIIIQPEAARRSEQQEFSVAVRDKPAIGNPLLGAPFFDDELGWCAITACGSCSGAPVAFYAPFVPLTSPVSRSEFFSSEADVLFWLRSPQWLPNISVDCRMPVSDLHDPSESVDSRVCPPTSGRGRPLRPMSLSPRQIRRVMAARENLFKFGTFIPRNDREATASPEAARWKAGRDLEWLRLNEAGTFETDWTLDRMSSSYPSYLKRDIGHLFYVYDFKFSGEHRVRLVFDGSRQGESTYSDTYAPTARQESVRLFHIVAVEESYGIGQYDVPQAFLKAFIDHDIFAYPPKGQSTFPGQLLKLRKALYGGKQSAYLWFHMMNAFILELGFTPSYLDKCLYKRDDAILILYCDDLRIAATDEVLSSLHAAFLLKFGVTTAPGDRFLGMDSFYDRKAGFLKLSMGSYIKTTVARFHDFDLSQGFPFRELVGCLLWITLNVMGPELLRVKDLARKSNSFDGGDYTMALKLLHRISLRCDSGIVITRGGAGKELIPSALRPASDPDSTPSAVGVSDVTGAMISHEQNELEQKSLLKARTLPDGISDYTVLDDSAETDLLRVNFPTNARYSLLAYGDASFAVGVLKQSVSGFIVYLNGVPLLWGSLKQTIVVDSSCSAEFVAASIVCKQLIHAENMIAFLGFCCPKPYRLYTDSLACFHIVSNPTKLGNVRHLQIRFHLVRCYVSLGDVEMIFCVTEEMVADLFTKLVVAAQDARLNVRFYSLLPGFASIALSNDFRNL